MSDTILFDDELFVVQWREGGVLLQENGKSREWLARKLEELNARGIKSTNSAMYKLCYAMHT